MPPVKNYSAKILYPKRFKKYYCLLLFILFFQVEAFNQNGKISFSHITVRDGLSNGTVEAILKDRYGFMWFGTIDGLNCYDGYRFKVYRSDPTSDQKLANNHITTLYEDRQGNLWVGTSDGLSCFNRKTDNFTSYKVSEHGENGLSGNHINCIAEDPKGNLWIGTESNISILDKTTGAISLLVTNTGKNASAYGDISQLCFDANEVWIGTSGGLLLYNLHTKKLSGFNHQNTDHFSISKGGITSIFKDGANLWIGTNEGILNFYNRATGKSTLFLPIDPKTITNQNDVHISIIRAGKEKLWLGTQDGIYLFNTRDKSFLPMRYSENDKHSISKGTETALYLDESGMLWVGTFAGGISVYDQKLVLFDWYQNIMDDLGSLSGNNVSCFAEGSDGKVWIGTVGDGLNLWDRKTNTFQRFYADPSRNFLGGNTIFSLHVGEKTGNLWIGHWENGLDCYNPKTKKFMHYKVQSERSNGLNNLNIFSLLEDREGLLWIGTNGGGVNIYDPKLNSFHRLASGFDANVIRGFFVRAFSEDSNGDIWIGTTDGLSMFNKRTKAITSISEGKVKLLNKSVSSLYYDGKQTMWVATLGGGVTAINIHTLKFENFTDKNGLSGNSVTAITADKVGNIWISSNNGISRIEPGSGFIKSYGLENGIQSNEFSPGAGFGLTTGEILFGGATGFNVVNTSAIVENKTPPPIKLTGFSVFNKPVTSANEDGIIKDYIADVKKIVLSYKESFFSFDFTAFNYTAPAHNQYAYKLSGFDKDWNYVGNQRKASYTNLDPGEYVFTVRAANNDGVWNDQGLSIKLVITPPYWKTLWFKIAITILLFSAVFFIYRARINRIKKQKIVLEKQVQERTRSLEAMTAQANEANKKLESKNKELEQFAYVASHDLQEPLRTISSFAGILQQQYKGKLDERSDNYINFIMGGTDRLKVLINDLLEYSRIGKKNESSMVDCNRLVGEVVGDLQIAIREAGAEVIWKDLPAVKAYPTEMKQIFQNLITNAIKFRKKGVVPQVTIGCARENGHWKFSVRDNGIGIDPKHTDRIFVIFQRLHTRNEYEGSGIGLSNCKKIAELHGGNIWVESKPGEGSNFLFTIKEQLN
jgi:signal transduction histidine kinase/ligand-binding sensor domain-containing protein